MRFYVNILSTYFPDLDPPYEVYYQQILEPVELAEELGFECFMFNEHHFLGYGGLIANPAVILAAAATRTSRIRLGPCVAILSARHPLQVAEDYAMVDAISGGRLEFGIGLGNTSLDYRVFEIAEAEGRARYEEAHDIIIKAWTNERFSYAGRFWRFEEIALYPRPVQEPIPPIWVAGTSPEGLRWAGRQGYRIMTVGHPHPPEKVRLGVEAWREGLTSAGCEPRTFIVSTTSAPTYTRARKRPRRWGRRRFRATRQSLRSNARHPCHRVTSMIGRECWTPGAISTGPQNSASRSFRNAQNNYQFDTLTHNFNFGGLPHEEVKKSMRLFAREVMSVFR